MRRCRPRWLLLFLLLAPLALLSGCSGVGGSGGSLVADDSGADASDSAPGAGIFGRVETTDSVAVAGASLELRDESDRRLAGPAVTDAAGGFDLALPAGVSAETGVLVVMPPAHPEARADVELPAGARLEVLVRVDPQGAVTVVPLLEPPTGAPRLAAERWAPALVTVNSEGLTEPFRLILRGQFEPTRADIRLVYREQGPGDWQVAGAPSRQEPSAGIRLVLGAVAPRLHGRRLEIRAVAAPPGRLEGITHFREPRELGPGVTMSPEPVVVFPVVTRESRLTADGIGPNALVVLGAPPGRVRMTATDAATLGLTPGGRVQLRTARGTVTALLEVSAEPLFDLASLQIDEAFLPNLMLDQVRLKAAGHSITIRGLP